MTRNGRANGSRPRAPKKRTEELVAAILEMIGEQPEIRPSQMNRLECAHSGLLRATLIGRGLVAT